MPAAASRRRTRASRVYVRRGADRVVGLWIRLAARARVSEATCAFGTAPGDRLAYDADGKLVSDGLGGAVVWGGDEARQRGEGIAPRAGRQAESLRVPPGRRDEQNRLLSVTPILPANGAQRITYAYDGQGRRIRSDVSTRSGSTWTATQTTWYVYDGWNVIEERVAVGTAITTRRYTWGLDLSGSLQGAGGVGGLVRADVTGASTATWWYHYDGNGNVTELTNATAAVIAHYRYTAFGETNVATGTAAAANPYRFSTKPLEPVSGYYYYGYRFYNPSTGRWPSRDPIAEIKGIQPELLPEGPNIYAHTINNPVNYVDADGLAVPIIIGGAVIIRAAITALAQAAAIAAAAELARRGAEVCPRVAVGQLNGPGCGYWGRYTCPSDGFTANGAGVYATRDEVPTSKLRAQLLAGL